jgi:hypothetical protein
MSWSSSHSVGRIDALVFTFVGWIQRPRISKVTIRWTDGIGSGSSDAIGFGNSKGQSSASSAPDDSTLWPAVYPTLAFKSYRDAPKHFFSTRWTDASDSTQRFIRRLCLNYTVLHRVGALQHRMVRRGINAMRRCIDWVTWFNCYISVCEWPDDPTLSQGEQSVLPTVLLFRETFPTTNLPC